MNGDHWFRVRTWSLALLFCLGVWFAVFVAALILHGEFAVLEEDEFNAMR